MSLRETISQDLKTAMKAKDVQKRDALRLLSSAFKQIEVDERKELIDEDIISIIQTQIKRRNDSATQYKNAQREELMQIELDEIAFYTPYLPKQLNDEELTTAVQEIIARLGATTIKDMGKVMGAASKELAGRVDGKRISVCVKELLN